MKIPEEFKGRVVMTRLTGMAWNKQIENMILKEYPGAEFDVLIESSRSAKVVIVFPTTEDCLSYHLKYGGDYV